MITVKSSEWSLSIEEQGKIVQGLDDIRQCLRIIFETRKGTDPLRPRFAIGIFEYIDKPVNTAIPNMRRAILEAVAEFEPRVEITSISHVLVGYQVTFTIHYKVKNTVLTDQIDITYGLTNS